MAVGRLSVKVGKVGKAEPHAAYISRMGKYADRLNRGERLEATGHGNMPAWAEHNPLNFWQAADQNERSNGSTYREFELSLPRELNPEQRRELVDDWIKQEIGTAYAYQYAIHNPQASDGEEQPHAHLMFSERRLDGIDRDPEQFFKRYNSKHPERGGAKKDNTGKDRKTRREEIKAQRDRWEKLTNSHLDRAGSSARIDMRSYKDQGLDVQPEKKMLPSEWRNPALRAEIMDYREAKKELLAARRELDLLVPKMRKALRDSQQKADARLTPEKIKRIREAHHNRMEKEYEEYVSGWHERSHEISMRRLELTEKQKRYPDEPNPDKYRNIIGYITNKKLAAFQSDWKAWDKGKEDIKEGLEQVAKDQQAFGYQHQSFEYFSKTRFEKDHPEVVKEEARIFRQEPEAAKNRVAGKKPILDMKALLSERREDELIKNLRKELDKKNLSPAEQKIVIDRFKENMSKSKPIKKPKDRDFER